MAAGTVTRFAVGSLNRPVSYFAEANGAGISIVEFDSSTGCLKILSSMQGIDNPTFLSYEAKRKVLYAISEVEGWNEGTVSAYRLDEKSGRLSYINKQVTLGSLPAHIGLDKGHRHVFVTNYSHEDGDEMPRRAMAVFPIREDGGLLPASGSVIHAGRGPSEVRQRVPHPHCAVISQDGDVVSVADLGTDRIEHYAFDERTGLSGTIPIGTSVLPAGSGPRHFVERGDGETVYVVNELSSTVAVMKREEGLAHWEATQFISALPDGFSGANVCAAIEISPEGRHLYCSNRGDDSIAIFAIDGVAGALSLVDITKTGGRTPRSFVISSDGGYLLVANQDSDEIVVFARNRTNGAIGWLDVSLSIGTPMCVVSLDERSF